SAHARAAGLPARLRARGRDRGAHHARCGVQARRAGRSAPDVPERRLHDPGQSGGIAGPVDAGRLHAERIAHRPADHRQSLRRGHDPARGQGLRGRHAVARAEAGIGDPMSAEGVKRPDRQPDASTVRQPYEAAIGLEVHAHLPTRTKMFCGCSTAFGARPNTQTCPICQGMPGTLPVINRRAIEFGIRTALAINCTVNADNRFARKHYYYPDMPKNHQISQYEEPLAEHGYHDIETAGETRRIGIQRLHLEEDVGKLVHEGSSLETAQSSQVDFNRAGVPLMEIVSKPDLRTPEEAAAYLKALRAIVVYLDVCDGNMEE